MHAEDHFEKRVLGVNSVFPFSISQPDRSSLTLLKDLFPLFLGGGKNNWLQFLFSLLTAINGCDRSRWRCTWGGALCTAALRCTVHNSSIFELRLSKLVACSTIQKY